HRRDPRRARAGRILRPFRHPSRSRLGGRPAWPIPRRPIPRRKGVVPVPGIPLRKYVIASALGFGATGALIAGISLMSAPAQAQLGGVVFDPRNYSQNLLTAAR